MTDIIKGPGEYQQENGNVAEIVGQDKRGFWLGNTITISGMSSAAKWRPDGTSCVSSMWSIVPPKPAIDIPDELIKAIRDAVDDGDILRTLDLVRTVIERDREKIVTDLTPDQWDVVHTQAVGEGWRAAVRKALELAACGRRA